MNHSDIEHMAQGYPPSHIGKDCEEVITWLATQLLATQVQRDALAAENAALKNFAWSEVVAADQEKEDRWMMECTGARDRFISMQTPTTDAYLNSVREDAVVNAAAHLGDMAAGKSASTAELIKSCGRALLAFAAQLRAGEPS